MFKRGLIGLLLLSLLLGTTSTAWAQEPVDASADMAGQKTGRPNLHGQVTAIDGNALSLKTRRGDATVLTDENTRYRLLAAKEAEAGLADVEVGGHVAVWGKKAGQGVLYARLIAVMPDNAARLYGTVEAVLDQTLTLLTGEGERVTVLTDDETRFFVPGVQEAGLADVEVGARAGVAGLRDEAGDLLARAVRVTVGGKRALVRGRVTAVEADRFSLETARGELMVQVDEETQYRFPGVKEPGLGDVEAGAHLAVGGTLNEDGSLQARLVGALPERAQRGRVMGVLKSIEGATLTLILKGGREISLGTDENTRFLVPGLAEASLDDLQVGDSVAAQGIKPEDEGELPYAEVVAVVRDIGGQGRAVRGELVAVEGASLSVKLKSEEEIQLLTDETTQFLVPGSLTPGIEDLKLGQPLGAQVIRREDGTLYASAVGGKNPRPQGRRAALRGRIEAVEGQTLTLKTAKGPVSVLVDADTRFRLPGVEDPGLADLEVGQGIGVVGRWTEDGGLQAKIIGARK